MSTSIKSRIALLIAEFFYCGRFPYAPGTAGTVGALAIWIPAIFCSWPRWFVISLLIILFIVGVWASKYGIQYYQKEDPKQVVIDEVVGVGIPFLVIHPTFTQAIAAFILFRFFDILKPWPIKWVERAFHGAWGIMLDDIVAGIFALIAIAIANIYIA